MATTPTERVRRYRGRLSLYGLQRFEAVLGQDTVAKLQNESGRLGIPAGELMDLAVQIFLATPDDEIWDALKKRRGV